jgi:hypothetical protein
MDEKLVYVGLRIVILDKDHVVPCFGQHPLRICTWLEDEQSIVVVRWIESTSRNNILCWGDPG